MSKDHIATMRQLADVGYFSRFLSVGAIGAVFDNIILITAVELAGMEPLVAKVLSAELSIVLMFVINEQWTFSGQGDNGFRELVERFATSNAVRLGGLFVGFSVLYVLHGLAGVWYLLANVVGLGVGFVVNYVAEGLFTWNVSEVRPSQD